MPPKYRRPHFPLVQLLVGTVTQLGMFVGQLTLAYLATITVKATAGNVDTTTMSMLIAGIVILAVVSVYGLRAFERFEGMIRAWRGSEAPTLEVPLPEVRRGETRSVEVERDFRLEDVPTPEPSPAPQEATPARLGRLPRPRDMGAPTMPTAEIRVRRPLPPPPPPIQPPIPPPRRTAAQAPAPSPSDTRYEAEPEWEP